MVKKTFDTPSGSITRDLTEEEINAFAIVGDITCKTEILKKDKQQAGNLQQRIEAIEKYLGV